MKRPHECIFSQGPANDRTYLFNRDEPTREDFRVYLEELWAKYAPFADSNFQIEIRNQFHQRTWEIFLGNLFLDSNLDLLKQNQAKGPDLKFKLESKNAWCEAVTVGHGNNEYAVEKVVFAERPEDLRAIDVPVDKMILRLTTAFDAKYRKLVANYIPNNIVHPDETFIIAINRGEIDHVDSSPSLILRAIYGVGHNVYNIRTKKWSVQKTDSIKKGSELISTSLFCDDKHKEVSAVIYSDDHIINLYRKSYSETITLVHNPFALNPIPKNMIHVGREFLLKDNSIINLTSI